MTVEIFKTDVQEIEQAEALLDLLMASLPECDINFDLKDCDKILRVAGNCIEIETVEQILEQNGYQCICLE